MSTDRPETAVLESDEPITNGAESRSGENASAPQEAAPPPRAQEAIALDENSALACYANFCRVSSTPEELILDFGLNPNPAAAGATVKVSQRIILNHYTAKRLLSALSMALQRHEQAFGVLENRRAAARPRP